MGENLTTAGIDLRRLPLGTRLRLGATAEVELTGLRTPCFQMNKFRKGLMAACLERDAGGASICNAGVMSIVAAGGIVRAGDAIAVTLPSGKLIPLESI
jgi:MOSC domain-containing protein YiiM